MSQTIDVKDLQVGSLVHNMALEIRIVSEITHDGWIRTCTQDKKQYFNFSNCELFEPIPVTVEWLEKLGGHDLSASKGRTCYGFCPEADGPMPPDMIHIEPFAKDWVLYYDGYCISVLKGVHHLQALVWNLERVWLTLTPTKP